MVNKLFVTKLSYKTTDESLEEIFKPFGKVIWCQVRASSPS
jgi:RNA recognition motif-containing protein